MPEFLVQASTERGSRLCLQGDWAVENASRIEAELDAEKVPRGAPVTVDMAAVSKLDTIGAWLITKLLRELRALGLSVATEGLKGEFSDLLERLQDQPEIRDIRLGRRNPVLTLIEDVGVGTFSALTTLGQLVGFLGLVYQRLFGALGNPKRLRLTPLTYQMEQIGLRAVPIVSLISFLIGAVIVNQGAVQLRQFGADVFVVDLLSASLLRELGVLLTAIIVAGRSGSAFTAQIGSMELHEEVDAIKTIGMDPIDVLVIPRLLALFFILPVLVFIADMMGTLGGGLMAWATLDVTPAVFVDRFREATFDTTFLVGMVKAPFFAVVIAVVGCFHGLSVRGSAESVGTHTTSSVVQSIFLVIVLDALFAVFFTAIGW